MAWDFLKLPNKKMAGSDFTQKQNHDKWEWNQKSTNHCFQNNQTFFGKVGTLHQNLFKEMHCFETDYETDFETETNYESSNEIEVKI